MSISALDYPAVHGRTVTQAHADYCETNGHATHTTDGVTSQFCPRCGVRSAPFRPYRATYRYAGEGNGAPVVVSHLLGDSAWVTVLPSAGTGHRTGDMFYAPVASLTRGRFTVNVDDAITALSCSSDAGARIIADLLTERELRIIADQVHVDWYGSRETLTRRVLAEVRA